MESVRQKMLGQRKQQRQNEVSQVIYSVKRHILALEKCEAAWKDVAERCRAIAMRVIARTKRSSKGKTK